MGKRRRAYDVAVIGAGVMGAATLAALCARNLSVIGFDQFAPPHDQGSSHGETRLLRVAYAEGAFYVPLVKRAIKLWRDLEAETNVSLFRQTGVVYAAPTMSGLLESVAQSSKAHDLKIEIAEGRDASDFHPEIEIPASWRVVYEPDGGYVLAEKAVAAMLKLAQSHGVEQKSNERISSIVEDGSGFLILGGEGEYFARKVILCCGPWISRLAPEIGEHVKLQRRVVHWLDAASGNFKRSDGCRPFCIQTDDGAWFYGFPSGASDEVKVADHHFGEDIDDMAQLNRTVGPQDRRRAEKFSRRFLPRLGAIRRSKTCVYSTTPDERFILGEHPARPGLFVGAGFSGHGFKFAPAVGEALAQMAVGDFDRRRLDVFSPGRFSVR